MGEVKETRKLGGRPLAPLIRAPKTSTSPRPPTKAVSSASLLVGGASSSSSSDPVHVKRRKKLRAVLAMMDRGSRKRIHRRSTRNGAPGPSKVESLLAAGARSDIDGQGLTTTMRGQQRRGAIAYGRLPTKSPHYDAEKTDAQPEPPVGLKKFGKLHTIAKIIVLLMRMCRTYILTENDAKMVKLFSAIDAAQAGDKYTIRGDLLFDVTMFTAKKQNKISSETKRVLKTPSATRTEKEIHHVQVELQQMEFVTKYPVHMQRGLVRSGAFESYETGRVIIRHGRPPSAFYLVLGGSAVLLEGDPDNSGRSATALVKGHVFGQEAIINRGRHDITVISKEHLQLLSLTVQEYSRIFMAGGMSNLCGVDDSSFIESVSIFKGWPLHLLKKHPKKCRFNFFTRGTVIEQDSNQSDWIYVLKSGSCAVLKKLHHEDPVRTKKKRNLPSIARRPADSLVSHEKQLADKLRDMQRKRARALRGKSRRYQDTRPKNLVRVPMREDPLSSRDTTEQGSSPSNATDSVSKREVLPAIVVSDPSRPSSSASEAPEASTVNGSESPQSSAEGETTEEEREMVVDAKPALSTFSRGPFLTHTKRLPRISEGQHSEETPKEGTHRAGDEEKLGAPKSQCGEGGQLSHVENQKNATNPSDEDLDIGEQIVKTTSIGRDVFVQIDTLESGAIFGVSDMVFGRQPSLCLVSNGAECILVAKKFYTKHATEANLKTITDLLRPYPTEETLLRDLREKLTWQDHRTKTLSDTAHNLRRHRRKNLPGLLF